MVFMCLQYPMLLHILEWGKEALKNGDGLEQSEQRCVHLVLISLIHILNSRGRHSDGQLICAVCNYLQNKSHYLH